MPDDKRVLVKCPKCRSFLLRTATCEATEVNCIDQHCKGTFMVTVTKDGTMSITEVARPVPKFVGR